MVKKKLIVETYVTETKQLMNNIGEYDSTYKNINLVVPKVLAF